MSRSRHRSRRPRRSTLAALVAFLLAVAFLPFTGSVAHAAVPAAPVLNADVNADKSVDLVWTPIAGATSYRICEDLYNPANGTGNCLGTTTDTKSRRGPLADGDYEYFVVAINADGETDSNKIQVTVPAPATTPNVSPVQPTAGSTVSGTVALDATCTPSSDPADCTLVSYLIDGQVVADDGVGGNTDGWQETWDSTTVANGNHYFQVKGTDADGVSRTTAPKAITVDNAVTPGAPAAPVLNADVNADKSVDLVWTPVADATSYRICEDLYNPANGTGDCLGTTTDTKSRRGPLADGNYEYFVVAINDHGETASNKIQVAVPYPLVGPDVTPVAPANGSTVSGNVTMKADCAEPRPCDKVDFLVDGQIVGTDSDGSNGWSHTWDSTAAGDGQHYFQVRGHRASNDSYKTTAPDGITVANGAAAVAPTAQFSDATTDGLTYTFTDTSTGSPTSWAWDFGDGGTSTSQNPSHTFAAGDYTVTLTATNATGSDTATASVHAAASQATPVASFTVSAISGDAPLAVSFTDTSTNSPTGWYWDFGDGTSSTAQNPSHTFADAGSYAVTLTASNTAGSDVSSVTTISVTTPAAPGNPTISLDTPADGATVSGSVPLSATASSGVDKVEFWRDSTLITTDTDGSDGWSAAWDSTGVANGGYALTAVAYDLDNNTGATSNVANVTVSNTGTPPATAPTASFTDAPTSGEAPLTVAFTDTSTGTPTGWAWDFGDGATSTQQSPTHTYADAGTYTVSLTASNAAGSDTASDTVTVSAAPPTQATTVSKLLVVIEENHSLSEMQAQMPYLNGLSQQYAYATNYSAIRHPSLPNYLSIAGGSTFGVTDDAEPSSHKISGPSVFSQATDAGLTAHTYAETMSGNCVLTGNTDKGYAVKHNPWAYFVDDRTDCGKYDTPSTNFLTDAANNQLANVTFLVPNKCNDAHDCSLGTADSWLKKQLPTVLASSDFTSGKLAVVVTADEDDQTQSNKVLTTVLQSSLDGAHQVVSTALTHYSLSRMLSQVSGSTGLNNAASAPDMAAAFGLTVGPDTGSGGGSGGGGSTSGDRGPTGTTAVWSQDFEQGLDCSVWTRMQNNDTASTSSACADVPQWGTPRGSFPSGSGYGGGHAFRSEVDPGDLSANGERSELSGDGASWIFHEGDEGFLQERIKVEPGMDPAEQNPGATLFYIFNQWHAGSGSPPFSLQLGGDGGLWLKHGGAGTIADREILTPSEFTPGTWFDIDIHFKMSINASTGGAEVYVNGAKKVSWDAGATMADADSYLKIGQYRNKRDFTGVVYFDDVALSEN